MGRSSGRYAPMAPLCKGGSPEGGGGLFPKGLFFGAASDYGLLNSRAVHYKILVQCSNPSAALNGRHLPLHKGGLGAFLPSPLPIRIYTSFPPGAA